MLFFWVLPLGATEITILHFNDFHGHVAVNPTKSGPMGGAARIAGYLDAVRKENREKGRDTFVLFGGDIFTGTPISSVFNGEVDMETIDRLQVTVAVVGNHEFDFGLPRLLALHRKAGFPLISSNIFNRATGQLEFGGPQTLKTSDGTRIAVIGLTTPFTPVQTYPEKVKLLEFADPVATTRQTLKTILPQSDVQIVLSHMEDKLDRQILKQIPEVDLLIGGHDHHSPQDPYCESIKKRLHCETPPYANYVGRIDLKIEAGKVTVAKAERVAMNDAIVPQKQMQSWVARYEKIVDQRFSKVIARAATDLRHDRKGESPLGSLVTDALRDFTKAQVALLNSGSIRGSLMAGPITLKDMETILPFRDSLWVIELTGKELEEVFRHSYKRGEGAVMQVSGLEVRGSKTKPRLYYQGKKILLSDRFEVCSNSFLSAGGDGYKVLQDKKVIRYYDAILKDAAIAYFQKIKTVSTPKPGRLSP